MKEKLRHTVKKRIKNYTRQKKKKTNHTNNKTPKPKSDQTKPNQTKPNKENSLKYSISMLVTVRQYLELFCYDD